MAIQVQPRFEEVYRCAGRKQTFLGVECKVGDIVPNATSLATFRMLLSQGLISGPHMVRIDDDQEPIGEEPVQAQADDDSAEETPARRRRRTVAAKSTPSRASKKSRKKKR